MQDIAREAKAINPNFLLYFNGMDYEEQAECGGNYLECECLPTSTRGYEKLPLQSHYMRTLGDMTILNMTVTFLQLGRFWRTASGSGD